MIKFFNFQTKNKLRVSFFKNWIIGNLLEIGNWKLEIKRISFSKLITVKRLFVIGLALTIIIGPSVASAGLVPCGGTGASDTPIVPCNLCHLFTLVQEILNFLAWIIAPTLAVLVIAVGGFKIMLSGPKPGLRNEGINAIKIAITGLLIVFSAWVVINETLLFFTNTPVNGAAKINIADIPLPWHKIECVIPEVIITPPLPAEVPSVKGPAYDATGYERMTLQNAGILANVNYCLNDFGTSGTTCPPSIGCTTLANLSQNAISGLIALKNSCNCAIYITGGTERVCHTSHGPELDRNHRVDVDMDSTLSNYIYNNTTFEQDTFLGKRYRAPSGTSYLNEGNHWHIEFNSSTP